MNRFALVSLLVLAAPGIASAKPKKPVPVVVAPPPPPPPDPNAWRATPPPPGPESSWTAPVAAHFKLSNGIPVYLVAQGDLPLVRVRLNLAIGREANPKGKAGLNALTASMLDEGTATRDSATIASDAAQLGSELSINAGDENVVVALESLTRETLVPSLDLLQDVVLRPKLAKADFARVRGDVLASLQAAKSEPNDVARRVFLAQLWGADHPYGVPVAGTDASVGALKLADIAKAYKDNWHAGNASFVVSGNVDPATFLPLLEARFGGWKKGAATRAAVAPPVALLKPRVVFKEQAGAVQSVLRVGAVSVSRTSPDYYQDQVAVTLLGGMFSSRLNMALREEKGWSYGAYCGLSDSRDHGILQARSSVQADKTSEAVTVVLEELAGQVARVPTEAEMTLTRDSLVKSLPGMFESNAATAGAFLQVPQFGLPVDSWDGYGAKVNGVDAAATASASQALLSPAHMLVVVVGPRTTEVTATDGTKSTVDVVENLKKLGMEFVEAK